VRNVNVQFNKNIDSFEAGPHVATVSVDLLGAEERSLRADEVLARWREQAGVVADVININFKEFQVGPGGLPIDIRLRGPDLAELKVAALEFQGWLGAFRGVFDLSDDLRPGKPEVRLRLREGAMALGLDAAGVASQLRSAFHGRTASEIQVGAESYEIDVRLSALDQDSLADLEYFSITSAQGRQIPLGTVATLEFGRGPARIAHVDGQRTVTVRGDVDTTIANANEIITETRERFLPGFLARHPSVRVSFEGQAKEGETTGTSVRTGFLIGITAVFVLMSFMFRSYVEPLIVLAAIPLGFVGVVWGHILMGLEISMPSVVGFVSLAGVVVNDSILLVEFIKLRGREGALRPRRRPDRQPRALPRRAADLADDRRRAPAAPCGAKPSGPGPRAPGGQPRVRYHRLHAAGAAGHPRPLRHPRGLRPHHLRGPRRPSPRRVSALV
jgi:multidrug efflux pump subunit AcrB